MLQGEEQPQSLCEIRCKQTQINYAHKGRTSLGLASLMGSELNLTHTNGTLGHKGSYETTSSTLNSHQKTNSVLENTPKGLRSRADSILYSVSAVHI